MPTSGSNRLSDEKRSIIGHAAKRTPVEAPPGPLRSTALRLMAEIRYNEESFGAVVEWSR